MTKPKRLSPFSKEFWMNKGMTEDEAEYKRNSIRPIRKEYWMERGYTEDAAIIKMKEVKESNNKKGAQSSKNRTPEEHRQSSHRCIEYWTSRGFTEEDAKLKIKDVQGVGSLEKFISRYGVIDGTRKWKERQETWQNTLNNKSQEEKDDMNRRKNAISMSFYSSIDECISKLKTLRNMSLFKTVHEYREYVQSIFQEHPYKRYYTPNKFIEDHVSKVQHEIFDELNIDVYDEIKDMFIENEYFLVTTGAKQSYRKWTDDGLLRSSYEIYFYNVFKEKFPDQSIMIDKPYPNSSFRYDFLINNQYIEICPMLNVDERYTKKMLVKKELFGCILLPSIPEIDKFFDELKFE